LYALQSVVITFHFKLDSGQIELLAQTFKIDEVVLDVVQENFTRGAGKKHSIHGVDPWQAAFRLRGFRLDRKGVMQPNRYALRCTPDDGSVQVCLQNIDKKLWVSLTDSGCGIAALDLPQIFERFCRGNNTHEEVVVHAGIGLSIVSRIVDVHDERMEAVNASAQGALISLFASQHGQLRNSVRTGTIF
jgi:K+-sensing histidine kinase KdpD